MLNTIFSLLQTSDFSLWLLFGVLVFCGLGLPIPEDIILALAGIFTAENDTSITETIIIMYFGILIGDCIAFSLGRFYGKKVLNIKFLARLLNSERQDQVGKLFHRYGTWVVFVARFLPGLRSLVFFTAGTFHYSFWKFILMDGLAALISAPFFVWLGHWTWEKFGDNFHQLERTLGRTQLIIMSLIALILIIFVSKVYFDRKKKSVQS
jgi:membrane protein DedA with SNARE-associated domain